MDDAPTTTSPQSMDAARTGLSAAALRRGVLDNLLCLLGRYPAIASPHDWYMALAYSVRDRMLARWAASVQTYAVNDARVACYLSAEFLIGPQLGNNLANLDIEANAREALASLGVDLDTLLEIEEEPGLGNGGLGRLAACYLDSLATLEIPAIGYGIRYEFGIFDQLIRDGWQVETTDKWLQRGNPWEIVRAEVAYYVRFGGSTHNETDARGHLRVRWTPTREVKGVACDIPIPGYRVNTCNTLRLWKSEAVESFDLQDFNAGDYYEAVNEKVISETLSKVLYPNDEPEIGKRLRLAQQYFFVSCSLQDMLRLLEIKGKPLGHFADLFNVQLNDTHPSIAVAELMRLLVDDKELPWDEAWDITRRALAYTNHTLLPEALETWGLPLMRNLLPRLLEIIYEINRRFLDEVRQRFPGDEARIARMSLIDERGDKLVRMAHLATVGAHAINGVAELHSGLLKQTVLRDFAELWPERFHNVTNGVTPRRFMLLCNPGLARLLDETVGAGWVTDLARLRKLEAYADDAAFQQRWRSVKQSNKEVLAEHIRRVTGIGVDTGALFNVQVKRIHEYKRQHLNALLIVTLYRRLLHDPQLALTPRCFVFGGKAAPGYVMAKLIIRLINGIAEVVNNDPVVNGRLKVVFYPDFNVKNAHFMYPAADLSEQISTAGKEASGTGNMKFMMNGALTIGTLDGANVEIREEVGDENFFLFGLTADEVAEVRRAGYHPADYVKDNAELGEVLQLIADGHFSRGDREMFRPLIDNLLHADPFLVLADYAAYVARQDDVSAAWQDTRRWDRMSILNTARSGKFSSDRAIGEYCKKIWRICPIRITLDQ
ncbi:glycogen/starch/alpha-glucan phosphorylase [Paraburkholderia sp. JPY303]|uniref:glycogen/starch/alpha-glucan phosphorylase n=1 Tax=Paraburkholderia atlantica TaxID=2654982 RepID=UPI0015919295|nr:glycogen/starch/alpha-glucan phosphorylase [Paraburkholderia atlantica]NUY31120.1 glycogen/starch/alpha-glucan phosphorylase [Paraburkholderia atlantica]